MMHERNEASNDWFHRKASGEAEMGIGLVEFTQILLEGLLNRHEQPETENTPFA